MMLIGIKTQMYQVYFIHEFLKLKESKQLEATRPHTPSTMNPCQCITSIHNTFHLALKAKNGGIYMDE